MARHIFNMIPYDTSKIRLFSTNGFIYDYKRYGNGNMDVIVANKVVYKKLLDIKNNLKPEDVVIIATDHDPAGALIALELLNIFPNAIRYKNRIDDFLFGNKILPEVLLQNSSRSYFNEGSALNFLEEKLRNNPYRAMKERILEYVLAHDNNNTLIIPEKYKEIIAEL